MPLVSYPHDLLPYPQQEGYGLTPVSPLMRTDMQSGRAKQRVKYNSVPTNASVTWLFLSPGQAQLFEGWYLYQINNGADWFEMKLKTPLGLQPYKCRFVDIYDGPTFLPYKYWQFTATLELFERPVIDEIWLTYYPAAVVYTDIIDLAINREWPKE